MATLDEFLAEPSVERTDEDRRSEAVGISSDKRYCACGCGQVIANDSVSGYRRGHKLKDVKAPKDPKRPPRNVDRMPAFPGADRIPADVRKDIEEKLEFVLSMAGFAWRSKDPYCGGEFLDRADKIAEKLVPLIVKNPFLLKFFTSEGELSAALELVIVLAPIGKTVAQHHIFKSIGHEEEAPNPTLYPVE